MNDFRFREVRTDYNKKKLIDQMKQNQKQIARDFMKKVGSLKTLCAAK